MKYTIFFLCLIFSLYPVLAHSQNINNSPDPFEKFTLDFPLRYTNYADRADPQLQIFQNFFFTLFKNGLQVSNNKENYLKYIFSFVDHSYQGENTIPAYIFFDLFNRHPPKLSIITHENLTQALKNHSIKKRSYGEFNEHSNLIHMHTQIIQEFAVGDYLFGIANGTKDNYLALRVLKAGDTHWQEFATISNPSPELKFHDPALSINKKKLHLTLDLRDQKLENIDQTITFSLNQDSSRSLASCKKEKKIGIHDCDNPGIQIQTLLK